MGVINLKWCDFLLPLTRYNVHSQSVIIGKRRKSFPKDIAERFWTKFIEQMGVFKTLKDDAVNKT
ncbi:hypothetical protein DDR33_11405 [Pararcticibacter amylolyticus]|uniref:Uncharacterized protein n=1 Tax=Pararcticibacter amylolyticus TaxID=2173175 RepID=A0A2U2PH75_9SPHI|nr:hypothetical protein DDR33_11405 [Pararcticibacter amylolyticus]